MKQKSGPQTWTAEKTIKDIRRAALKHHSAEDKIRIVLEGLRGEDRCRVATLLSHRSWLRHGLTRATDWRCRPRGVSVFWLQPSILISRSYRKSDR